MKKLWTGVAYALGFILATLFVASMLSGLAQANTIAGNAHKCDMLAGDAVTIAQLRDQGMTKQEFHKQVDGQIAGVVGSKDSYMEDKDDVKMTMDTFDWVFENPDANPKQAMRFVQQACMAYGGRLKSKPINLKTI